MQRATPDAPNEEFNRGEQSLTHPPSQSDPNQCQPNQQSEPESQPCSRCNISLSKNSITLHTLAHERYDMDPNGKEFPFRCEQCSMAFSDQGSFQSHRDLRCLSLNLSPSSLQSHLNLDVVKHTGVDSESESDGLGPIVSKLDEMKINQPHDRKQTPTPTPTRPTHAPAFPTPTTVSTPNPLFIPCSRCTLLLLEANLKYHALLHELFDSDPNKVQSKFRCEYCCVAFPSAVSLSRHRNHHCFETGSGQRFNALYPDPRGTQQRSEPLPNFHCTSCNQSLPRNIMDQHNASHVDYNNDPNGDEFPDRCDDCRIVFPDARSLRKHRHSCPNATPVNPTPTNSKLDHRYDPKPSHKTSHKPHPTRNHNPVSNQRSSSTYPDDDSTLPNSKKKIRFKGRVSAKSNAQSSTSEDEAAPAPKNQSQARPQQPQSVSSSGLVRCEHCSLIIPQGSRFYHSKFHQRYILNPRSKYRCDHCTSAFPSSLSLSTHFAGSCFKTGSGLQANERYSEQWATQNSNQRQRIRTGPVSLSIHCPRCDNDLPLDDLAKHNLAHEHYSSDPRGWTYPHQCKTCRLAFPDIKLLHQHYRRSCTNPDPTIEPDSDSDHANDDNNNNNDDDDDDNPKSSKSRRRNFDSTSDSNSDSSDSDADGENSGGRKRPLRSTSGLVFCSRCGLLTPLGSKSYHMKLHERFDAEPDAPFRCNTCCVATPSATGLTSHRSNYCFENGSGQKTNRLYSGQWVQQPKSTRRSQTLPRPHPQDQP